MATLLLKNVSSARGDLAPPITLNLEIRDRELVALTGPAGCGVSTILRMIAGLEATQGDVLLDGRRLNDLAPMDREVALVSANYAPYPRISVFENLALGLRRRKFPKTEIEKRVRAASEMVEIQGLLERAGASLSGEERQRLALARAVALQPKLLLFEEPFSTLEPRAQIAGRAEIKKLHQRMSVTMIYATRDPTEAMAIADRLLVFNNGAVEQDGSGESIYAEPANVFVAGFVGSPPMNLVQGILKQDRDSLLFSEAGDGTIQIRLPGSRFSKATELAGKTVVLGVRPEDLEILSGPAEQASTGFRALVERVETKGAETDLYLQTGAHMLICRSGSGNGHRAGGYRAQFGVNVEKTHLFEASSGALITRKG